MLLTFSSRYISLILTSYLCYLHFIFLYMHNNHCHRVTANLQPNIFYIYIYAHTNICA
jgi:hypothetical protein